MKPLGTLICLLLIQTISISQNSFILNEPSGEEIEAYFDIKYKFDQYFCLRHDFSGTEQDSKKSILMIYDKYGVPLFEKKIGVDGYACFQILDINSNFISILGSSRYDSCTSSISISEYYYQIDSFAQIAKYDFCDNSYVKKAKIVNGLNNSTFIEGYYSSAPSFFFKFILQIDSNQNITKLFDSLGVYIHFSIDFSRNGYVLIDNSLCDFYDLNFNYRKQRYNFQGDYQPSAHATHQAFGQNYLIEHIKKSGATTEGGHVVRLIDSNLVVKKYILISPSTPTLGFMDLPFFGGLKYTNQNSIWMSGTYGFSPGIDSNFFSISQLDSNLNIICSHFLGYDAIYRLFGVTPIENEGVIVFGWRLPKGHNLNSGGEDAYAIKLGANCELPTTSVIIPNQSIVSISVYPNPGINDLTFSVQGFDPTSLRMEMIDLPGSVLFSASDLTNSIQVPDLPAGQYFYRILQRDKLLGVGSWVKE